jgi:hypothetical protein
VDNPLGVTGDDEGHLSPEDVALLSDEELHAYVAALEHQAGAWTLQAKQLIAEKLTQTCDIVGYGGAAGGGKSDWGLWHVYELSKKYPTHRSLVLRRKFPELRRSLIARSLEKFDTTICRYRPGEKEWHFANKSVIEFGYLDRDDDVYQYKSAEYDCIFFDEATELTEFQFDYLRSRCRTAMWKHTKGVRPHIIAATNPGGVGHAWFKRRLVEATNHGEVIVDVEVVDPVSGIVAGHRRTAFVPATLFDNAFIDPEYKLNLMMLPDVEMRQLLYGDWDVFAGQFFADWRRELHVVRPFTIPASWPRIRAIDYGYAHPFVCLWFAFDGDRNAYVYREVSERKLTATEQAKLVIARSVRVDENDGERRVKEHIDYSVADPSIWSRQGTGVSIASQYRDAGLYCKKAMNARIDGWSRVREWLRPDPERGGQPALRVFPACTNLIEHLPDLVHDAEKPEDIAHDTNVLDDEADALRYGLMSRPRKFKPKPGAMGETFEDRVRQHFREAGKVRKYAVHDVLGKLNL